MRWTAFWNGSEPKPNFPCWPFKDIFDMEKAIGPIRADLVEAAMIYSSYRALIDSLLEKDQTTGHNDSQDYLDYTRMNVQRMSRWDKTAKVSQAMKSLIESISEAQVWMVLTEAWCGDAAQNIPYLVKLAELNPLIQLRFILRDEHPDVMDEYLTQGTRSIPKLVALPADLSLVLFEWGPRPAVAHEMLLDYKKDSRGMSFMDFSESLHLWYARNKNQDLENELFPLIQSTLIV